MMSSKPRFRTIAFFLVFMMLGAAGCIVIQAKVVSLSTARLIDTRVDKMPGYPFILVLGSGNTPDPASRNYSFSSRMDKTAELYHTKKITRIVVSGVSNKMYYNEPNDMKAALVAMDVPAVIIYPDHGGLRTFLSVKRMKEKAGKGPVIIVSQRRQLERALYIARCLNMECAGLEAAPVPRMNDFSYEFYEMMARVKCLAECIVNQ